MALRYGIAGVYLVDEKMYVGSGTVARWLNGSVLPKLVTNTALLAPVNKRANTGHGPPGGLKRSVSGQRYKLGTKTIAAAVSVDAPYAKYVIEGTKGPIYSHKGFRFASGLDKRLTGPYKGVVTKSGRGKGRGGGTYRRAKAGYFMRLPINPQFGGYSRYHYKVSGQKPNPFMIDAYNKTARSHRALNPMVPKFNFS